MKWRVGTNQGYRARHLSRMNTSCLRSVGFAALGLLLTSTLACSKRDNPDEIRERTAEATQTMRRDAKAVAEGVREGMSSDKTININDASREDLLSLPGLSDREADRIIRERPFKNAHELVARQIISDSEYDKIRDRITVGR